MPDWDKILTQVAVVTAAPIPFLVAVLIATGLIWWLMNWRYSALIGHKDAEIKLLERQKTEAIATPAHAALNAPVPADSLKPVHLKNIRVELPSDSTKFELFLDAEVATASDRVQIILDCTSKPNYYGRDWNGQVSFRLADLKDLFKGQLIHTQILTYVHPKTIPGIPNPNIPGHWSIPPNPIQEQFFWGDVEGQHPISFGPNRVRLSIGPTGQEQQYYFLLIRTHRHGGRGMHPLLLLQASDMDFREW